MRRLARFGLLAAAIIAARRHRHVQAEVARPESEDQQATVDLVIAHAAARLQAQLQDSDELATKALGVLAVDASALAVLVAVRGDLHGYWWAPALGLGAGGLLLLATVWPRTFDTGPDPTEFYEEMGAETRLTASEQMLSELTLALDNNDNLGPEESALQAGIHHAPAVADRLARRRARKLGL